MREKCPSLFFKWDSVLKPNAPGPQHRLKKCFFQYSDRQHSAKFPTVYLAYGALPFYITSPPHCKSTTTHWHIQSSRKLEKTWGKKPDEKSHQRGEGTRKRRKKNENNLLGSVVLELELWCHIVWPPQPRHPLLFSLLCTRHCFSHVCINKLDNKHINNTSGHRCRIFLLSG